MLDAARRPLHPFALSALSMVLGAGGCGARGGGEADGGTSPASTPTSSGTRYAVEVGHTSGGSDYTLRPDVPQGGTLFSVWMKIPDPGSSYPWSRGNMDVYILSGANWHIRALGGNSSAMSASSARYNANTMIFADPQGVWAGDYSYYESNYTLTDAVVRDWVWVAWQIVVADGTFSLQQWLKLGVDSPVFAAGSSAPTLAQLRSSLITNGLSASAAHAWTPADATSFQVGSLDGYLFHARMQATATAPTLDELEAIAASTAPDSTAWGDYLFDWENGAANLKDQSGHGRDLQLAPGGTLHQGPAAP